MRQSWNEYVEGRLAIGGCGLAVLVVGFVIAVVIIGVNNFIEDFDIANWPIWVFIGIIVIMALIKVPNKTKKDDNDDETDSE